MAKSVLGRGLGELLGEMGEAYENEIPKNTRMLEIPIKDIKPNPYQPRKTFDERSLHELSESIKEHGLLQPIVVIEGIDDYVLVAGERRLRASKLAKNKTIKAVIANITEAQMRQHALVENIQREELNAIELASAYQELINVHSLTHDELSVTIHKSRSHITNTIRLLQLTKKSQKALVEGKISAGHAKMIVGLDEKEQLLVLDSILGQKLSVRETEAMIQRFKNEPQSAKRVVEKVVYDFEKLNMALDSNGFKHKINGNKLTIEFKNEEEIASFLNHFS